MAGEVAGTPLRALALGVALGDLKRVGEDQGPNLSADLREWAANLDPPYILAQDIERGPAWCGIAIQWWSDRAARLHGLRNPLDVVELEAWCPSYAETAVGRGWVVPWHEADPGCQVLFNFHGERWDHTGLMALPVEPDPDGFLEVTSVDGNTNQAGSRDGDRVLRKVRLMPEDRVLFSKWDEGIVWHA